MTKGSRALGSFSAAVVTQMMCGGDTGGNKQTSTPRTWRGSEAQMEEGGGTGFSAGKTRPLEGLSPGTVAGAGTRPLP